MPAIPSTDDTTSTDNHPSLGPQSAALPVGVKFYSREPRCEKCLAPLGAAAAPVCRNCGWYSAAGTFIEIDRAWEGTEQSEAPAGNGFTLLPRWAWLAIATAAKNHAANGAMVRRHSDMT